MPPSPASSNQQLSSAWRTQVPAGPAGAELKAASRNQQHCQIRYEPRQQQQGNNAKPRQRGDARILGRSSATQASSARNTHWCRPSPDSTTQPAKVWSGMKPARGSAEATLERLSKAEGQIGLGHNLPTQSIHPPRWAALSSDFSDASPLC